jgi:autotransporter-associated beta strand protein
MRIRKITGTGLLVICTLCLNLVPVRAQRQIENIDRGLLAIKKGDGVYLSWRVLGHEYLNTAYNLYRGTTLLNTEPITGATCFFDSDGSTGVGYSVAAVVGGVEQAKSVPDTAWWNNYKNIPLQQPPARTNIIGESYTYVANDASVGDLDGDGQYEIVLLWDPSNSIGGNQIAERYTGNVILDAYEMDGTLLWRIDLGVNIRAGAHHTMFMVYDLDGDGKAEVACRTADGTTDGVGIVIGDADADHRNSAGYILTGPEFLTVFDGETGAALATENYSPARGAVTDWGDDYGNRGTRFLACVAYLDGIHPSLVMCRGYYYGRGGYKGKTELVAWDFKEGSLSQRWTFTAIEDGVNAEYAGQGNHSVSVADVDEDGKDEIIYGAMAVDDDGTGLWTTGLYHGDAMHVSDIDPNRPGLEKWGIHEGSGTGSALLDARTGEILWHSAPGDVGRGVSADLVAKYPGMECWGGTGGLRTATGEYAGENPSSSNFLVWWDGDELRELLNSNMITKYGGGTLLNATGCVSNNGTKSTPALSADLIGDWREEVMFRTADNKNLRIYASTDLTTRRLYTLMHDPQYRLSIAWQMVGYNQPPHPGFFLGHGMADPPPPPIVDAKLKWNNGNAWDLAATNWTNDDAPAAFQNGDDVLFDLSASGSGTISISGDLSPSDVSFYSPLDYTLDGPGSLTGSMDLLKAGAGNLTLNSDQIYSGKTTVWSGSLEVNGNLEQSAVSVYKEATVRGSGTFGAGLELYEKGILEVGPGKGQAGTIQINDQLTCMDDARICFDLSDDSSGLVKANDLISVEGNVDLGPSVILEVQLLDGSLQAGQYTLIEYSGTFTGDLSGMVCAGLDGVAYSLVNDGTSIILEITKLRDAGRITWKGDASNDWDLASTLNWLYAGSPDWFVPRDTVLFNDEGNPNTSINLTGSLYAGQVLVDASIDYTLEGGGVIGGTGGLVKNGSGILELSGMHEFTGATQINEGTLKIKSLKNADQPSSIGAASADPSNLVFNGGTLRLTGTASASNRGLTIAAKGGTLLLAGTSPNLTLHGQITGNGLLKKTGNGELTLTASNDDWSGGLLVQGGNIILGSEEANIGGLGSGKLSLENTSLQMFNNTDSNSDNCAFDLVIPQGSNSWLHLDGRCSLTGSLEGSGTLNLETPFIRSGLNGDWSAFSGRILVSTSADNATFLPANQNGFENAAIELSNNVAIVYMNSEDASIKIGELSGTSGSELGSGGQGSNNITWIIGDRNSHATFHGLISDRQFKNSGAKTSVIKSGTGSWTLTHANTYSGDTEVRGGILSIENTSGSATGTGNIFVRSGASICGNGVIEGNLSIDNGASLFVGKGSDLSVLTVTSDVSLQSGSYLSVKLNVNDKTSDKLMVLGHLNLDGILYVNNNDGGSFATGESYQIIDANSSSGNVKMVLPANPGEGLEWDTTYLGTYGYIRIVKEGTVGIDYAASGIDFSIFPNPGSHIVKISSPLISGNGDEYFIRCYDQIGRLLHQQKIETTGQEKISEINVQDWVPGFYLFELSNGDQREIRPFIKH